LELVLVLVLVAMLVLERVVFPWAVHARRMKEVVLVVLMQGMVSLGYH